MLTPSQVQKRVNKNCWREQEREKKGRDGFRALHKRVINLAYNQNHFVMFSSVCTHTMFTFTEIAKYHPVQNSKQYKQVQRE